MKLLTRETVETNIESVGLESSRYGIAVTAKSFRTLIDDLYTDKELAVIRELASNAVDSHAANGTPQRPWEVHLPTMWEPHFSVRDFGTSLTHEQIMGSVDEFGIRTGGMYTTVFESTRTGGNDTTGGFGLGSKSPFAISDSFTVVTYLDGEERTYLSTLDAEGIPICTHLSTLPTDEPNGLLVTVTPPESRRNMFLPALNKVLRAHDVMPTCNVELKVPQPIVSGDGWRIYANAGHNRTASVQQGTVIYPSRIDSNLDYGHELVIEVPIGTVDPAPSREALSSNYEIDEILRELVEAARSELADMLEFKFAEAPTFYEATKQYLALRSIFRYGHNFREVYWEGRKLTGTISSLVEVRHSDTKRGATPGNGKLRITITPGQETTETYIIDRAADSTTRKRLRIQRYGTQNDVRAVLYDPAPAQIKALRRAHREHVEFIDVSKLPDVHVARRPSASRPPGTPVGLYTHSSYYPLPRAEAYPEPGKYIAVVIESARPSVMVQSELITRQVEDVGPLLADLSRHFDKPVLLLTTAAVKKLKPGKAESFDAHIERFAKAKLKGHLAAVRAQAVNAAHPHGIAVSAALLGIKNYFPTATSELPSILQPLPLVRTAVAEQRPTVEAEIDALKALYPTVFRHDTDAVIVAYIATQKENSKS